MVFLSLGIYIVIFYIAARMYLKYEGAFSTVVVFGLAAFIYYLAIPVEIALTGVNRITAGSGNIRYVDMEVLGIIAFFGTIAYGAFVVGYMLSGFTPYRRLQFHNSRPSFGIGLLTVGAIVLLLIFYLPELAAVGTYLGNVSVSYRSPAFALLVKLAYTGMAVTVSSGIATGRFGILKGL